MATYNDRDFFPPHVLEEESHSVFKFEGSKAEIQNAVELFISSKENSFVISPTEQFVENDFDNAFKNGASHVIFFISPSSSSNFGNNPIQVKKDLVAQIKSKEGINEIKVIRNGSIVITVTSASAAFQVYNIRNICKKEANVKINLDSMCSKYIIRSVYKEILLLDIFQEMSANLPFVKSIRRLQSAYDTAPVIINVLGKSFAKEVLLSTSVGDIDIELWSKEAPKACRNFVQLCIEKYYDNTIFHRIVKGFIAQGGDPNGDGTGGHSIYGQPFKDEFHSRLRFVRRGLVAMANGGKDDNESQFFFTFAASPELQDKNTIFGKVSGTTLFNMLKLEDCLVNEDDRPIYPPKIISSTVLLNPFLDILPRTHSNELKEVKASKPKPNEQKKNFKLLSFGEEAEEEESEVSSVTNALKGKSKSIHDLGNDPNLSSVSAASLYRSEEKKEDNVVEQVKKKFKTNKPSSPKKILPENEDEEPHHNTEIESSEREEIRRQIKMLQSELKKKATAKVDEIEADLKRINEEKPEDASDNPLLKEFHECQEIQKLKQKEIRIGKAERQKKTMDLLAEFQMKLRAANDDESELHEEVVDDEDIGDLWMTHSLKCSDTNVLAKDANIRPDDWYDIRDPRNPINQRRRQEKKDK